MLITSKPCSKLHFVSPWSLRGDNVDAVLRIVRFGVPAADAGSDAPLVDGSASARLENDKLPSCR